MKRLFLGIDLPEEIKSKIEKLKRQYHLERLPIKLVEPENSHIALKFLDKLDDNQIEQIDQTIKNLIKEFQPFKVKINNSLVFPNLQQPKVLTLKIISKKLELIGNQIIPKLEELPFVIKDNKKYTPHITLGRIKTNLSNLEKEKISSLQFTEEFQVTAIQLFESQLTSNGPIYTTLQVFNLK